MGRINEYPVQPSQSASGNLRVTAFDGLVSRAKSVPLSQEQQLVRLYLQHPPDFAASITPSSIIFLPPSSFPLSYSSPCGRNCSVRPPGLSGSQRSIIPGLSRRQPLALQTLKSLSVCQSFSVWKINVVTDGCL